MVANMLPQISESASVRMPSNDSKCAICGWTVIGGKREGVCKPCRERAVLNEARALYVRLQRGHVPDRELRRLNQRLCILLEKLDGNVLAAVASEEEIAARVAARHSA